jgi:hypothetical protein
MSQAISSNAQFASVECAAHVKVRIFLSGDFIMSVEMEAAHDVIAIGKKLIQLQISW